MFNSNGKILQTNAGNRSFNKTSRMVSNRIAPQNIQQVSKSFIALPSLFVLLPALCLASPETDQRVLQQRAIAELTTELNLLEPVIKLPDLNHDDIANGVIPLQEAADIGAQLFSGMFTHEDGAGRPQALGNRAPVENDVILPFVSVFGGIGGDANSCAACHQNGGSSGRTGKATPGLNGLLQAADDEAFEASKGVFRSSVGMHGSGIKQAIAEEMTKAFQAQAAALPDGEHVISAKGVDVNIRKQDGQVVYAKGLDNDLVVKPFHRSGSVTTVNEFTNNALFHHHGIDPTTRAGENIDFDNDGLVNEISEGNVLALTLWQNYTLRMPGFVLPSDPEEAQKITQGFQAFESIECSSCHKPWMKLDDTNFRVVGEFAKPGDAPSDISNPFYLDLASTQAAQQPRIQRLEDGSAMALLFSDLVRHYMCDSDQIDSPWYRPEEDRITVLCNEQFAMGRPEIENHPGQGSFITYALWDTGTNHKKGLGHCHTGELNLLECILAHAGEARNSRDAFLGLDRDSQLNILALLKSMQVFDGDHPNIAKFE